MCIRDRLSVRTDLWLTLEELDSTEELHCAVIDLAGLQVLHVLGQSFGRLELHIELDVKFFVSGQISGWQMKKRVNGSVLMQCAASAHCV